MGIYTNRYVTEAHDYASEIPANEAYGAAFGCAQILADCQRNDMALFESSIYSDFEEVRSIQEGTGYVNENAFTDVIKKIVEMFKKLLAKIKGIFMSFIAKLTGAFKNGKDLVKKYEKQIIKYANWKDFKCKGIRMPKSSFRSNLDTAIGTLFKENDVSAAHYGINLDVTGIIEDTKVPGYENDPKKINDADAEDLRNAIVKLYVKATKTTDVADLHENVMDYLFEDEETIDGDDQVKGASFFSENWIKGILSNSEKWLKAVKKFNEKLEKNISTIIDNLNKADDKLAKFRLDNKDKNVASRDLVSSKPGLNSYRQKTLQFSTADADRKVNKGDYEFKAAGSEGTYGDGTEPEKVQKAIHALQKLATNEQEVITKVTSEYMSVVKFSLAQARKIWTAAAAWSSGVHKESVEYAQAVGESAAEQFYMNMEAVY